MVVGVLYMRIIYGLNNHCITTVFTLFLPSIHAEYYHCILLMTKSNNVVRTLRQAKLGK